MNDLYNKKFQDIIVIFALLLLNIVLFDNVYASTESHADDYDTLLVAAIDNSYNGPSCEEYNEILVKTIYGTGGKAYTEEDYLNELNKSVYGEISLKSEKISNQSVLTSDNVFFADAYGLRVIKHKEISKVIKSAKIGASIIASPALLEFAKINGIPSNGKVLSNESVKQISIYLKQFLTENRMPKVLAFVREGSRNIETSLASMISDKTELNRFINQHQFELVFPGMLIDFTSIVEKAQNGQRNT